MEIESNEPANGAGGECPASIVRRKTRERRVRIARKIISDIAAMREHWLHSGHANQEILDKLIYPQPLATIWGGAIQQLNFLEQDGIRTVGDLCLREQWQIRMRSVYRQTQHELARILRSLGVWYADSLFEDGDSGTEVK